jgi:hypothetical protein
MAKRRRRAKGGLPRVLGSVSSGALRMELERRAARVGSLLRKERRLLDSLERLREHIHLFGGEPGESAAAPRRGPGRPRGSVSKGRGRRRRPQNEMNLRDALRQTLKGRTMSVTEVAQAVQDAGYKTTSPNFRTIVNQTLIKGPPFKKVARGKYTAS